MFTHYRTQGFILNKVDSGEADRIFTIYTKDFGKLGLLARAERKITSKLRMGLKLFYLSEVEFIQGKTYKTLTDVILIEKFENIRKDLKRLKVAYKISDVLDGLVKSQESDEKIWQLLAETFNRLNGAPLPLAQHSLLYYYFIWNLFALLGYEPDLYNCSLCQKKLPPEKLYFNQREGGIICSGCFKKLKSGKETETETIKILRVILEKNWQTLTKLKIEEKHLKGLSSFSQNYLSVLLERIR